MKSVRSIAALALLAALSLTSCKKYYTCTCTTTAAGVVTTNIYEKEFRNYSKINAEEKCQKKENEFNTSTAGVTDCKL